MKLPGDDNRKIHIIPLTPYLCWETKRMHGAPAIQLQQGECQIGKAQSQLNPRQQMLPGKISDRQPLVFLSLFSRKQEGSGANACEPKAR